MKLQISFDIPELEKAIDIAKKVVDYCDILEVGNILIHRYGIHAVETFTSTFKEKEILADTKIIDRGKDITKLYKSTGIKWLTVMAGTSNTVIHRASTEAEKYNINIMLDMVDSEAPGQSALEAKNLGVDGILFHKAYDAKESLLFLEDLDMVQGNTNLPVFISARITRENVEKIIETKPYGIIIGDAITDAEDPAEEAKYFYNLCHKQ